MLRGFSLVELSIVLVILGLLTGGILAGQSLVRASELRAVTSEYQRYVTAVGSFRDKYFALPGDMTNAQSFWGVAHATPATCVTTASTSALTCNGNGDGIILASTGSQEIFRFWQHLANAGLIEGSYSGVTANAGIGPNLGDSTNSPRSRMTNGLWYVYNWGNVSGNALFFTNQYDNVFAFGAPGGSSWPNTVLLKPEELWNLDTKLDDGKPQSGKIIANPWPTCTTAASATDSAAAYLLSSSTPLCAAIFRQAY